MSLFPLGLISQGGGNGSGGNALTLISTTLLGADTSTVTFSSIVGTYKHLQIRFAARNSAATVDIPILRFNSDSGANYSWHRLQADGTSVASAGVSGATFNQVGFLPGSNSTSGVFGVSIVDILDYANTNKNKTVRALDGVHGSSTIVEIKSGGWFSTAAVTSITLSISGGTNFVTGSRFSLYGVS